MPTRDEAMAVLRGNDRGGYTVPTAGLYPFQWNWDSALSALGWACFDRDRAWLELSMLLLGQWPTGMVPHIVFWEDSDDYFPGPQVWGSPTMPATSGITQPPVIASVARHLVRTGDAEDLECAALMFASLLSYHRWLHDARDPDGTGVVAVTHPWETGRDNCPDWDVGLAGVEVSADLGAYQRADLGHVAAEQRPTNAEYDRYLTLVAFGRECGWDQERIYRDGPFLMADPGVQFILTRADRDLLELAELLGETEAARQIGGWLELAQRGAERLWDDELGAYTAVDLRTGRRADGAGSATMLAWYAGVGDEGQRARLADSMRAQLALVARGMPSWDPRDERFDPRRYWRGPVWAVMNHLIATGLAECGEAELAARLRADSRALIDAGGFCEYYDPLSGEGLGGGTFSWTAAMSLVLDEESEGKDKE